MQQRVRGRGYRCSLRNSLADRVRRKAELALRTLAAHVFSLSQSCSLPSAPRSNIVYCLPPISDYDSPAEYDSVFVRLKVVNCS